MKNMKYCYLVAEGPHDIEFLAKIIRKQFGLLRRKKIYEVDPFWKPLIPTTFPVHKDDDLQKRLPLPLLLQNDNYSIALDRAEGIENLVNRLEENSYLIDLPNLFSIGLILDADEKEQPLERFNKLIANLSNRLNTSDCDLKCDLK